MTPLFELWDQFLCSSLSKQLIVNLRFNNDQWKSCFAKTKLKRRYSFNDSITAKQTYNSLQRSNSLSDIKNVKRELSLDEFTSLYKPNVTQCENGNGCGTPTSIVDSNNSCNDKRESKVLWDIEMDEELENEDENETIDRTATLPQTFSLSSHTSLYFEKVCIDLLSQLLCHRKLITALNSDNASLTAATIVAKLFLFI